MQDAKEDESYWRQQHGSQPYADKSRRYEDYAPAYRLGAESATKNAGKKFEDIESDLALDYEKSRPGDGIPWDHARPAVKAAWDRIGGVIAPRDTDRGIRSGI